MNKHTKKQGLNALEINALKRLLAQANKEQRLKILDEWDYTK